MDILEFTTRAGNRDLVCSLMSPPGAKTNSNPALLLTFATTRQTALSEAPYNFVVQEFLAAGHYIMSFDLPNHGEHINSYGQGIDGMRNALLAGADPFTSFVQNGISAIDAVLARGLGIGNIYAWGESRGAYCAIRLAAADARVRAVVGMAPVTDWRILREFADVRDLPQVAALSLENFAHYLSGRPVFLAIGNKDDRVSTSACVRLALKLWEGGSPTATAKGLGEVHVVESEGHSIGDPWRAAGAQFLLGLPKL
ncbi:MAG: prolyl oligopeptidase family serine peptidase [Chloroflexi bacterium]|nr:prolyl oligopeptidase family serine peptidase [Chloroflexota bacterium]